MEIQVITYNILFKRLISWAESRVRYIQPNYFSNFSVSSTEKQRWFDNFLFLFLTFLNSYLWIKIFDGIIM